MDDETQEINIYAINYEKIIDLLKQYDGEIVPINFIETDYSYADLIDIVSKIDALPVVQNNIENLRFISPMYDSNSIWIQWKGAYPEFGQF